MSVPRQADSHRPAHSLASSPSDPCPGRRRPRLSRLLPALALLLCSLHLLAAATAFAQTAPSVPRNVLVVSDDNKLTLTWVLPESWGTWEEEHFEVNWKLSASNAWCTQSISPGDAWCAERIEFTDYRFVFEGTKSVGDGNTHTVANGTVYDFRIRAVSQKSGTSGTENSHFLGSDWVTVSGAPEAHIHGPLPGIPTLAGVESGQFAPTADTLSFTVSCVSPGRAGVTDYVLRIVNAGDGSEVQLVYLPGPVPACRHTDPAELLNVQVGGLTAATTYRVRAFARNLVGRISPWSNPVELATTASADPNSLTTGPGLVVSATELGVTAGGTATYTVKLGAPPTDIVAVTPTVDDGTRASVSPSQLVFTMADWSEAQTVTVSGTAAGETSIFHSVSTQDQALRFAIMPTVKVTVSATGQQGTSPNAALISQMYEWRNDPQWVAYKAHTDRWDRALLALGETVSDNTLTPMTPAEAQDFADQGWTRWVEVAKTLKQKENADTPPPTVSATVSLSALPNPVTKGSALGVTATLSTALASNVTIPLTVTRGTSEDGDHGALSGIAIPAGLTSGTGTITTTDDTDTDDETFTVALGSLPSGVTAGSPSSITITITDDTPQPQSPEQPSGNPAEVLEGTPGRDALRGGPGSDEIYGRGGHDYLFGYGGRDLIYGGPGDDVLNGGEGNDELNGGSGNDRLTGGPGADRFVVYSSDTGDKRILDFDRGAGDRIVLRTEDGAAPWPSVSDIITDVATESTGIWVYDLGDDLYVVTENIQLRTEDFVTE